MIFAENNHTLIGFLKFISTTSPKARKQLVTVFSKRNIFNSTLLRKKTRCIGIADHKAVTIQRHPK